MRFWRSHVGAIVLVVLVACGVVLGATVVQVRRGTMPQRVDPPAIDFPAMRIPATEVQFSAADGVPLGGWLLPGPPGAPAVILCHDAGSNRAALLNLAIRLHGDEFTILLFDFRGHGQSGGTRSTFGLEEKRDVLGAADLLVRQLGPQTKRVGVYGVGMGAYAAVLAAADRPVLRVLVLDGLYPDVEFRLVRQVYAGWEFAVDRLAFLPRTVFSAMRGGASADERASDVIGALPGRDFLFLVPAGDSALAEAMQRMYESIPAQADADGNLVVLPATLGDGLYDEQLARYHERVSTFFVSRLRKPTV
jgi:pimeloyl-ACP methyl ester carboxylesterase